MFRFSMLRAAWLLLFCILGLAGCQFSKASEREKNTSSKIADLRAALNQLDQRLQSEQKTKQDLQRRLLSEQKKNEDLSARLSGSPTQEDIDFLKQQLKREHLARVAAERSLEALRSQMRHPASSSTSRVDASLIRRLCIIANELADSRDYRHASTLYRVLANAAENPIEIDYRLGRCLSAMGDTAGAVEAYRKVVALGESMQRPPASYARACNNLGVLLRSAGQYKKAIAAFEKAVGGHSASATPYYNLGLLFEENLHDFERAIQSYQQYIKLGGPLSDKARARIAVLKKKPAGE